MNVGGAGGARVTDLALDGSLLAVGDYSGALQVGGSSLTAQGISDGFLLRLAASGTLAVVHKILAPRPADPSAAPLHRPKAGLVPPASR